jgi:hypothetical protein
LQILSLALVSALFAASGLPLPFPSAALESQLKEQCAGGAFPSCTRLAQLHTRGDAMRPDPRYARDLLSRACAGGDGAGCLELGIQFLSGWTPTEMDVYRDGALVSKPLAPDLPHAVHLFESTCSQGYAPACGYQASLEDALQNKERACWFLGRACALGDQDACANQTYKCATNLRVANGEAGMWIESIAAQGTGVVVVESRLAPHAGGVLRVVRLDEVGRFLPIGTAPDSSFWRPAACPDGQSVVLAAGRRVRFLGGSVLPVEIPLPGVDWDDEPYTGAEPTCLADGSAVVIRTPRWRGEASESDYRGYYQRRPDRFTLPEKTTLERLGFAFQEDAGAQHFRRMRSFVAKAASDLRSGAVTWDELKTVAQKDWRAQTFDDTVVAGRSSTQADGNPPPEVFTAAVGSVVGPVENVTQLRRGRRPGYDGGIFLWRIVARSPARVQPFSEALTLIKAQLLPRLVELFVVSRAGIQEQLSLFSLNEYPRDEQYGPVVPLDDGFLLFGADRRAYRHGHWSKEHPLLTALQHRRVKSTIREPDHVLLLTDHDVVLNVGLDGRLRGDMVLERSKEHMDFLGYKRSCSPGSVCQDPPGIPRITGRALFGILDGESGCTWSYANGSLWIGGDNHAAVARYRDADTTIFNLANPFPWLHNP